MESLSHILLLSRPVSSRLLASLVISMFVISIGAYGCQSTPFSTIISHGDLTLEINDKMQTKVSNNSSEVAPFMNSFQSSDYLVGDDGMIHIFNVESNSKSVINDEVGSGQSWVISGIYEEGGIKVRKTTTITAYDDFPDMLTTKSTYENLGIDFVIKKMVSNHYVVNHIGSTPSYWAFQGSSTSNRSDWIRPLEPGYYDRNYMGMNNSDYGGGIPVTDIWRPDAGLAIGHTELTPQLVSLPTSIKLNGDKVNISVELDYEYPTVFKSGTTEETLETFVSVHRGDYYTPLSRYSHFMQAKGIEMAPSEDDAYESIWCAWGYERNFTLDEVIGTLPKVKELGIQWAVLDDGFQIAEGEWDANPDKFENGNDDIKNLVKTIHDHGLKAKIWWTPMAADPHSKALQETPEMMLYTSEWTPQFITWWDAYYLGPKNPHAIDHTREAVRLFMRQWGFDGLKMDGQHMNAVPPDHNPASKLDYPEQAVEGLPDFFKMIYDEARAIKPNAVVENCPCGTCMSFFNMAHMNQAVSSDPLSSWQIRHKGKTYKALIPNTAYYGDHVELSDDASDFASSFGIGAVLGTKFTWPKDNPTASESFLLTPEKEVIWKKWFDLYHEMMLSKEEYVGDLYDIGFDKPETHVIKKGDKRYYAFYADSWSGPIELRGLEAGSYKLRDYFNEVDLGSVDASSATLALDFTGFMLIEATPL